MSNPTRTIFILILVFHISGIVTVFSQNDAIDCPSLKDLKPLEPEVKKRIIEFINGYISQAESEQIGGRITTLYCPPTALYFDDNCAFPKKYENIHFYLALLLVKPNSTLLLEPHNDRISYNENPEFNNVRADTVKQIFIYFGVDANRISINDIKDERPIGTNKTEEGRTYNRYVKMSVAW